MLQGSKGNGDGRVEMGSGDVAGRQNNDHDGKAGGGCEADKRFCALCLLVHNGCGCPCKDEYEGAYELGPHLDLAPTHHNKNVKLKWISLQSLMIIHIWMHINGHGSGVISFPPISIPWQLHEMVEITNNTNFEK